MVDTAEPQDKIDLERAKAAMGRAEEGLKHLSHEDKEYRVMEAALQRALNRIKVAGRRVRDIRKNFRFCIDKYEAVFRGRLFYYGYERRLPEYYSS